MKFGLYEQFKKITTKYVDSKGVAFLVASMVAGAAAAVTLCPMEATRIRLVTENNFAKVRKVGDLRDDFPVMRKSVLAT